MSTYTAGTRVGGSAIQCFWPECPAWFKPQRQRQRQRSRQHGEDNHNKNSTTQQQTHHKDHHRTQHKNHQTGLGRSGLELQIITPLRITTYFSQPKNVVDLYLRIFQVRDVLRHSLPVATRVFMLCLRPASSIQLFVLERW